MKKTIILALTSAFAMAGGMGLTSCGGDDSPAPVVTPPTTNTGENKPTPTNPTGSTLMAPAEQKSFLDETAVEFMRLMPSSDFQEYKDLTQYIGDRYESYDNSALEDWSKDIYDACVKTIEQTTAPVVTGNINLGCIYHDFTSFMSNHTAVSNYMILLSQFKGNFTAENGKWTKKNSDHLQFNVKDRSGQTVSISMTYSGKITTIHVANTEDSWQESQYADYCPYCNYFQKIYTTSHFDKRDYKVEVPENITITLTQGQKTLLTTTLNLNPNTLVGEEFSLGGSNFAMTMNTVFSNGYSINVEKCQLKTRSDVAVNTSLKKAGKTLIGVTVTSSIEGLKALPISQVIGDFDEKDFENANGKNPIVEINILDKVQIKGKVTDIRQAVNYINTANDNNTNAEVYKRNISLFNSCIDLGLYFNYHNQRQASISLDPFQEYREVMNPTFNAATGQWTYNYDKQYYWTSEAIINFLDGSKYSTFTAFFNDRDFKNTIKVFEDLMDEYDRFLGEEK